MVNFEPVSAAEFRYSDSEASTILVIRLTLSLPSSKSTFCQPFKESDAMRIGSIIIFFIWVSYEKFFTLCDVIFLVRLQEKFDIDPPQE